MERTLNKISRKMKTNLDKFSYESSYAKLNDSQFNVSQANESETYKDSALPPLFNGHFKFFCPYGGRCREVQLCRIIQKKNYSFKSVHCSKM